MRHLGIVVSAISMSILIAIFITTIVSQDYLVWGFVSTMASGVLFLSGVLLFTLSDQRLLSLNESFAVGPIEGGLEILHRKSQIHRAWFNYVHCISEDEQAAVLASVTKIGLKARLSEQQGVHIGPFDSFEAVMVVRHRLANELRLISTLSNTLGRRGVT